MITDSRNGTSIFIPGTAGELHVRRWGTQGPALLALHGVTGCTALWYGVARNLHIDHRVIAFDYRGHGRSAWSTAHEYDTEFYVADLLSVCNSLSVDERRNLTLVGSSWGALAAVRALAAGLEMIKGLVIVDVEPSFEIGEFDVHPRPYTFQSIDDVETWERKANPDAPHEDLTLFSQETVAQAMDGTYHRRHDPFFLKCWPFRKDDVWAQLGKINQPTIILNGDRSFVRENVCRRMSERLQHSKYVKIKNSGHLVPLEQPESTSDEIRRFIHESQTRL
ncbi:alpha/beta hydrolase [Comamonas sp. SCN 65-56]|uniref:alpha/beta fold hydrolase n=1 Tax=Comamonas sp. SCN 65-56 TaxID=1660095 RepID=UPI0025C3CCCB|nr:alpha/beta hydrolase [Comamonas sp. SCN 65-56]